MSVVLEVDTHLDELDRYLGHTLFREEFPRPSFVIIMRL